jgi:tetratricopeptide (TPR) repeat protein
MIGSASPIINPRYRILNLMGEGGMGAVYRAHDRLTGETVALKHVAVAPGQLQFTSRTYEDPALALAQEFAVLASLRHPHIIAVRDYGFDAQHRPFFTMDLLENAPTVAEAGRNQSFEFKINLLQQMLLALTYLHRRGIVHRDLKPGNVLVTDGVVKMLDFGLSIAVEQAEAAPVGSLAFMAPEVLKGQSASVASDLYAVGLIAYELLVGRHPFDVNDASHLIDQILMETPNWTTINHPVTEVLGRLLVKDPQQRFADAATVIRELSAVTDQELPLETRETRESFLQAAKFVGREAELTQLTEALKQARQGQGSAWLIGGESGVGKSRLIDELRTRALVRGALVLSGQAVEGGGLPYQLWREPLRRAILTTELSDLEASVLKEIVPDVSGLLGREVADAPVLPGEGGRQRLTSTIVEIFKRQTTCLVVLFEDVHWSSESLEPLRLLTRGVDERSMLIASTYRDDERPNLPHELPAMRSLKLTRLNDTAIATLSASILGEVGEQSHIIKLLQRETEGNTFFIVEVVRTLAEEAGQLSEIGHRTLPSSVFAGGMQALLRRRLGRIPRWARPLLDLAALMGRHLDLKVLQLLDPQSDLARWLDVGNEAAVLEVRDEQWRFAHDKLREAVERDVAVTERPALHRRIAEALETAYPGDTTHAESLLHHWQAAGDEVKELQYLEVAAYRLNQFGIDAARARQLFEHGLELAARLPDSDRLRMRLLRHLADVCDRLGELGAAKAYGTHSLSLAEQLGDQHGRAEALYELASIDWLEGNNTQTAQRLEVVLQLARASDDLFLIASGLNLQGILKSHEADYAAARDCQVESLRLFREINNQRGVAVCLLNLGNNARRQGDYAVAVKYLTEGLAYGRAINARRSISDGLSFLALVARQQGDLAGALNYISQCLILDGELDDRLALIDDKLVRASIQVDLHDHAAARQDLEQSLRAAHQLGAIPEVLEALAGFARLFARTERADRAAEIAGLINNHPTLTPEMRNSSLEPLLAELQVALQPDVLAAGLERGRSLEVNAVVQELLEQAA